MKKVAVIGRGTAGAQATLHLNTWKANDYEVEWYFDDTIPTQSVGEGSTLPLPSNLCEQLGFTWSDLDKVGGTLKTGIYKRNWTEDGDREFFHDFPPPVSSIHFQAKKLHAYILDSLQGKLKIEDKFIGSHDDIDADYIFDCGGKPKKITKKDFHISDYISVNTAKVWQCYWDAPRFHHTLTIAGRYGWFFGIPLSNRLSIGYVYNRDFATLEQIEEEAKSLFEEYNVVPSKDGNYIEFNSYWRLNNFNERVSYNGNSSFFLEPLEATSTAQMDSNQRKMFDIVKGNIPFQFANLGYNEEMQNTETVIMLHYLGKPFYKNDFWEYANERANKKFESIKDNTMFKNILKDTLPFSSNKGFHLNNVHQEFGTWQAWSFIKHFNSLNLKDKLSEIFLVEDSKYENANAA